MKEEEIFKGALMGFDPLKQIFDLWYEVSYLRAMISYALQDKEIPASVIEDAKKYAKSEMNRKFPKVNLEYMDKK